MGVLGDLRRSELTLQEQRAFESAHKFLYHQITIGQLKGDKTLGEVKDEVL